MSKFFTSESVTEGHPDKICDQISDTILDEIYKMDKNARVACETAITNGLVMIMGEISTHQNIDIPQVVKNVIKEIGYTNESLGFDINKCAIIVSINEQSKDIALGLDKNNFGAGDQGIMFGFACDETPELMPLPISIANKIIKQLTHIRKNKLLKYLRPDGKTQVTIEYDKNNIPIKIDNIVLSTQHSNDIEMATLRKDMIKYVIEPSIPKKLLNNKIKYYINPTGRFVIGGPVADSGLTGRKIIVDTYGGYSKHGGGAFSGKDPTKVDRSGAYAARYIAKNIVASGLAKKCEVQLSYAIGIVYPTSVMIETFGTSQIENNVFEEIVKRIFDFSPEAIIKKFKLHNPIYKQLATLGHMGRIDLGVEWEKIDLAIKIKQLILQYPNNN